MRLYYGMTVYPSLERSYFKSSCMYIEPEFSKIFSIRNFCEYFYPRDVLIKKCRVCCVSNYHYLYLSSDQSRFTKFSWLHTHELLA